MSDIEPMLQTNLSPDPTERAQFPARPQLTLRVGIIGHRFKSEKVTTEDDYLAGLTKVLETIDKGMPDLHSTGELVDSFDTNARPQIRVITGIAYGTDRWAQAATQMFRSRANESKQVDWSLELISPAPTGIAAAWAYCDAANANCDAYATSWQNMLKDADTLTSLEARWRSQPSSTQASVHPPHLPDGFASHPLFSSYRAPPEGANSLSYAHAADFQLRQCDMIIAVWDGQGSRGPGGTADIATKAVQLGMPVIWIRWDHPKELAHFVEKIETAQTIPPIDGWLELAGRPIAETPDIGARMEGVLRQLFEPPPIEHVDTAHKSHVKGSAINLATYYSEKADPKEPPGTYARMVALLSKGFEAWTKKLSQRFLSKPTLVSKFLIWDRPLKPAGHWAFKAWNDFIKGNPDEGAQSDRLLSVVWTRFAQADQLAIDYAARYRSAFVRTYLLSAIAVLIALIGLVLGETLSSNVKAFLVFVELVVLLFVFKMVRDGQKGNQHAKLVEYRALAEGLRHQAWLATFGEFPLPVANQCSPNWVNWYLRTTGREIGPPQGTLDASFQSSLIDAVVDFEIKPQLDYHEDNAKKMHAVHHGLHSTGDALFGTTGAILVAFLVLYALKTFHVAHFLGDEFEGLLEHFVHAIKPWVGFFAAFLPTLGSALAGIRFTGDFEGKATQSETMAKALQAFHARADVLKGRCDWATTRTFLLDLEALLSEDVAQFHSNYGRQPLALPA
jgi:hypothetical protein